MSVLVLIIAGAAEKGGCLLQEGMLLQYCNWRWAVQQSSQRDTELKGLFIRDAWTLAFLASIISLFILMSVPSFGLYFSKM